jgi:hypothetical protein
MDLKALKARLQIKSGNQPKEDSTPLKYFKTEVGKTYDIRILDISDTLPTKEPIFTLLYYKKLGELLGEKGKIISPKTFDETDVISEIFDEMRKKRTKEDWNIAKNLKPDETCFALIIDRNQENEGPLVWELKPELRNKIYNVVINDDFAEEKLFDAEKGFDWALTVSQKIEGGKPKFWKNYPVKEFDILPKRKSSKLHKDPKVAEKWLTSMPNLYELNKKYTLSEEKLKEKLDLYLEKMASEMLGETSTSTQDGLVKASNEDETEKLKKLEAKFAEFDNDETSAF